eukprot:COSAG05_NODE_3486_length_2031_cov_1.800207_2_plen_170_part_00
MQEDGERNGNRVLLETRNNGWADEPPPAGTSSQTGDELVTLPADVWFADACLQSSGPAADKPNLAIQFATNCTHPVDTWYNIAVTVEGSTLKHFVNGVEEVSPARSHSPHELPYPWIPLGPGSTSLGMRINAVSWFKGAIRGVRVSPEVLPPSQFLAPLQALPATQFAL